MCYQAVGGTTTTCGQTVSGTYQDINSSFQNWRDNDYGSSDLNNATLEGVFAVYGYANFTPPGSEYAVQNASNFQYRLESVGGMNATGNYSFAKWNDGGCWNTSLIQIQHYFLNASSGSKQVRIKCYDYLVHGWSAEYLSASSTNGVRIYEYGIFWNTTSVPSITEPAISPPLAYYNSILTANTTYADGDGNAGNVSFKWYNNNTEIYSENFTNIGTNTILNVTLGPGNFSRFSKINLTVSAVNALGQSATSRQATPINISNSVSSFSAATLAPIPAVTTDNLTCTNSSISNLEGDTLTIEYSWFENDIRTPIAINTVGAGNLSAGEKWYCKINVTDGYNYSGAVKSDEIYIDSVFITPIINSTNATRPDGNFANSTHPINNNSYVTLAIEYTDDNSGEKHTAYFCKTNSFTGSGCAGTELCKSAINTTDYPKLACNYTVSPETAYNISYYAFVLDNSSLVSLSKYGSFIMNYPPSVPTLNLANDTWTNNNYTLFQPSSTDTDAITYIIYSGTTYTLSIINNSAGSSGYNWTNLNETSYYWQAIANDSFGYYSNLSVMRKLNVDYTAPILENATMSTTSITASVTGGTATFAVDCYDSFAGVDTSYGSYNLLTPSAVVYEVPLVYSTRNSFNHDIYYCFNYYGCAVGAYTVKNITCRDKAGNSALLASTLYVSMAAPTVDPGVGGGGGGGGAPPDTAAIIENITASIGYVCGNDKCEASLGESTLNCQNDCPFDVDRIFTCIWTNPASCIYSETWFTTLMVVVVLVSGAYLVFASNTSTNTFKY